MIDTPGAQTLRNNADLFVKRGAAPVLSRAAAAMALFTLSSYAPAGGTGHRTSLRGGGPMTTLIVAQHSTCGSVLWGRLWPNVESREQIEARVVEAALDNDAGGVFPWLVPSRTSNPKAGGRSTTPADVHPLQVYWGMPRRIRLLFELAQGQRCGLTAAKDSVVATSYRTRNYGINYSKDSSIPDAVLPSEGNGGHETARSPQPRRHQLPAVAWACRPEQGRASRARASDSPLASIERA